MPPVKSRPVEFYSVSRTPAGKRIWRCSQCGHEGIWRKGWMWFGSWLQLERDQKMQQVLCPKCSVGKEALRATTG